MSIFGLRSDCIKKVVMSCKMEEKLKESGKGFLCDV